MLRPTTFSIAITLCFALAACDDTQAVEGPVLVTAPPRTSAADGDMPTQDGRDWFAPSGERMDFAAVGLSIERPAGFAPAPAEGFALLSAPAQSASIALARLRQPYAAAVRGYDAEAMAQRGTAIDSSEDVEVAGLQGLLSTGVTSANGLDLRRVLLVVGDDDGAWLVTANVPVELWSVSRDGLVSALNSVRPVVSNKPTPPR